MKKHEKRLHTTPHRFGIGNASEKYPTFRRFLGQGWAFGFALILSVHAPLLVKAQNSSAVKKMFADPPKEYSTAPLWVWNDMMTEEEVRSTLRDLHEQSVRQAFVHPRPGLMTPYLSDEWFALWKAALDEATRLDMNLWIYDENSYPSGFAGGWVPEWMPESRGRGLSVQESEAAPSWNETILAVYRIGAEGTEFRTVTDDVRAGKVLPAARYLTASVIRAKDSPWTANRCYVDLLYPGVTEKFLQVTLEAYRERFGNEFGKRIPGSFTDEPELQPAGGFPWTEDLPAQFASRWHYSLLDSLPALTLELGDWRKIRHDYFSTLNFLFIERWAKPYYEWCEKYGMAFTGHYWEHAWPNCRVVPDNMAMSSWQQIPGIDCLMNTYAENTHAQFGNVRAAREIASIANQLDRRRALVEIYGAGGWDLRFEDMKRIGDWLLVHGINLLDEHLSWVTIRGARKRDHPQSFSYHEPWWSEYHVSAEYLSRLCAALSQGRELNPVLVIEPTSTAWMYQGKQEKVDEIGKAFFDLLLGLESAQVEYDLGCEEVIASHGEVRVSASDGSGTPVFRVGSGEYKAVVFPPGLENLRGNTAELMRRFLESGGFILSAVQPPGRVEGAVSELCSGFAHFPRFSLADARDIPELLGKDPFTGSLKIRRALQDKGTLFHYRRRLPDGELLFLVNTNIENPSAGSVESGMRGAEIWNPYTGTAERCTFERYSHGVTVPFTLPPSGSLLLFLYEKPLPSLTPEPRKVTTLTPHGPEEIERIEPNVLVLDYVDVTAGGETRKDYFYRAGQFVWQKNGLDRNPWDSAVQFKDELISKRFPRDSGFEAHYRFTVAGNVPGDLAAVIERPDLYSVTCNGIPVKAGEGEWWLDRSFGKIPIASTVRPGENCITISASPMTLFHELEPAYVIGSFALKTSDKGYTLIPEKPLQYGKWNMQGLPFYAQGVAYRQHYVIGIKTGRFIVSLEKWYGSVARVRVNGKEAGIVAAPPWECDVTRHIRRGDNEIEVTVTGTLKNTLGPHHGDPKPGSAWPGMFSIGPENGPPPGERYSTVGYGLFEPFTLKKAVLR